MSLATVASTLPATKPEVLEKLRLIQDFLLSTPQLGIQTEHIIHGGMYTRTIRLAAEVVLTGALIKVPTMLIVTGSTAVFTGEGWIELEGIQIIAASAGRKQIFVTHAETTITMIFRTNAQTVEQAEAEFTDEAELLASRHQDGSNDIITITGE